ncbi:hypothetical protein ACXEO8_15925 [Cytobacillus firmus]
MELFINTLPSMLGVVVGGLITFFIQQSSIKKQLEWEREKMELDNFQKDEDRKFETYNKILQADGDHIIHDINYHTGAGKLQTKAYNEYIRPLLFDIYHLLDEDVAEEVENIENVFERQYIMEEEDPTDKEVLSKSYLKIISLIKQEFKNLRSSKRKVK